MNNLSVISKLDGMKKYLEWRKSWGDEGVDVFSFLSSEGSPEEILVFCKIILPDLVIFNNFVFLEFKFDEEQVCYWATELENDMVKLQSFVNSVRLYDVFSGCQEDVGDTVFEILAEAIATSWEMVLKNKFPSQEFVINRSSGENGYGPVVSFYQKFPFN
ncbi:hypothetical protein [Xanthomonas vesicatoria]|uniref:hypothetical protein n=1 Tax=Xanthomonas vesicatoria TaxID=56460 RepID=UPI001E325DC9|nr:hypothetical protein [Xanthomonas vesicatoria]MCC8616785.1 hypothetical protein [Xanthomonas vesicatoria]MCC8628803.1 hypothetical protein [Xanthomonas vesicatoria]MCC8630549.1 hypothetical protein [Xanthomonas vesicatoria]MDG4483912.1 hypothetical protein [Xanthomonas vesicatoria]